ncbi:hypothetical protein SERLADRAFT_405115 [Serpula lacrymans var. lacrymans S7.9]|uniref:DUF6830 domain-containing protein n=1 Tax=Serpula lacrymans var. lacrymans (strain S7.9) TaxID=578457 RepID=F8NFL6_SERL9|nr:uncharacterized protein SERLADRAFT_405115 [Serpula lacrymans var. lacrymans S7.9]EGO31260.1 hypothetical protein SERLADRAFT_405115 [Serpula lacrymans var. lacrymans S7.9]
MNLKIAAKVGTFIPDPFGTIRYVYTPLVAYQADLPEAQVIACVAKNSSPVSLATQSQFGNAEVYPPCTARHTLEQIFKISQKIDPWKLNEFQIAAKEVGINGVHQPFWRNWHLADPSVFLTPKLLHTCYKFFFDHVLVWCKEVLGHQELDNRYKSHNKRVGFRHFDKGVTSRTIFPTIAGAVAPNFVFAIQSMIDFIYAAQHPVQTPSSIKKMVQSLEQFHWHKGAILEAEARRGKNDTIDNFRIPKLELMQHFARSIENNGTIPQYTGDVILDHVEKRRMFDLYTLLRSSGKGFINQAIASEDYECALLLADHEVVDTDPHFAWISSILPQETRFTGSRLVRNHFIKGILSDDASTAFHITVAPNIKSSLPFQNVRVWFKFRIQLHLVFDNKIIMPSQLVQAYPRNQQFPWGNCDTVLLGGTGQDPQRRHQRVGRIVPLTAVAQAVELIPLYGATKDPAINNERASESQKPSFETVLSRARDLFFAPTTLKNVEDGVVIIIIPSIHTLIVPSPDPDGPTRPLVVRIPVTPATAFQKYSGDVSVSFYHQNQI